LDTNNKAKDDDNNMQGRKKKENTKHDMLRNINNNNNHIKGCPLITITEYFLPHLICLQDSTFDFQILRPIKPYVLHLIQAHNLNIYDLPGNIKN
jgi:hypothetical protein